MLFNFLIWITENPPRADKSAPTDGQIILLKVIIASHVGWGKQLH